MKADHHDQEPEKGFQSLTDIMAGLFPPQMPPQPEPEIAPKGRTEKPKQLPQPSAKLVKASVEIHERPDDTEAAYMAREVVLCTLPHRDPKADLWVRRNGNFSLALQAGYDSKIKRTTGLPYGSIPRLILLWLVTEAVRTKSRHIKLGDTLNDFLREIGLDPDTGRGKRGDATRLKEQLTRLLRCRISFEYNDGKRQSWRDMLVADDGDFWWDDKSPDQATIFESQIELGEKFFKAITAAPVPLDLRALIPLKQSPLAIDLYTWATYRLFTMQRARRDEIKIPLSQIMAQLGSEYNRPDNFKAAFIEALAKVQQVFPALDYAFEGRFFVLRDHRRRPAIAPTDKTAAQKRLAEQRPFDQVSDKAREWFKSHFPRMSADAAIVDFYTWREEKGQQSGNTDAHFKAFAKTWEQRNQ